ncbi:MAG: hypothetical protein GY940_29750 [bacterium]|nr:hypothetical protein [bacterium]
MSNYIIGGWSQSLSKAPPSQFSYTMYGMITNLEGLTSGTPAAPGWSPAKSSPPTQTGTVLWTYGGGFCTPPGMPANQADIDAILQATTAKGWGGVDVDDECDMNIDNIASTLKTLKPASTSYTFLAGWSYNNPGQDPAGQKINDSVQQVAQSGACDRFVLMCYAAAMWSMNDITANVGPAIQRTINYVGDAKKVILALTPKGLTTENRDYFLDQVTSNNIGGLFIWNFPALKTPDLDTIVSALGI